MIEHSIQVGDIVTCNEPIEAYYSNYPKGVTPYCTFTPEDIGIVAEVSVPYIWSKNGSEQSFCCVDFFKPGVTYNPHHPDIPWRCGMSYNNIKKLA